MRTGEYCISNIDKLVEEGCITQERATELKKWQRFRAEHPDMSGLSEKACRPLMREKDPKVQAKAIEVTGRQVSHGPRETAQQIMNRLRNIKAGKGLQGGEHLGKAKDAPERKFGDYVEPIETVEEEKDIEETDPTETIGDEVYPVIGGEDGDIGDIPEMPDITDPTRDTISEAVIDPKEIEEDTDPEENIEPEPEITSKAVKENLINAGHVDLAPRPKPARTPTEEDKQSIFEKCISQAIIWDMDGDEIYRRMEKAIMFIRQKAMEE